MLPCFPVLCAPKAVTITANSLLIHCQYSYSYSSSYYSYSYYCVQHSLKHTCNARMRRASSLLIADLAARRSTLASTVQYSSANAALINVENSGNKQTAQFGLPGSSGHMDCTDKGGGGKTCGGGEGVAAAGRTGFENWFKWVSTDSETTNRSHHSAQQDGRPPTTTKRQAPPPFQYTHSRTSGTDALAAKNRNISCSL